MGFRIKSAQVLLGCAAAAILVVAQQRFVAAGDTVVSTTTDQLRGNGDWQPPSEQGLRAPGGGAQQWDIDLKREADGSISGRVTLTGSPLIDTGTLTGKIVGDMVTGTMQDNGGRYVARFAGRVTESGGLEGRYEDRTGEVGMWAWAGPLPK